MTARASLSRRDWLGLIGAGAGAGALGIWLGRGRPAGEDVSDRINTAEMRDAPGFPAFGAPRPAVTMLVFSDYACGVCRAVEPVWEELVHTRGDVRVVHRDWPVLGPWSLEAATSALAAAYQGRYLAAHRALMRTGPGDPASIGAALLSAGVDRKRLAADRMSHAAAIAALLARTRADAQRLGFPGTPGFLAGPVRHVGGASARQFSALLDRARDAARTR